MYFLSMTDKAIAREIGHRLKSLRLKNNLSQKKVAHSSGLSVKAIQNAEKGESAMLTYIKILRVLNMLESLEGFLPEVNISPLELAKMEGKKRQRATGSRKLKGK